MFLLTQFLVLIFFCGAQPLIKVKKTLIILCKCGTGYQVLDYTQIPFCIQPLIFMFAMICLESKFCF